MEDRLLKGGTALIDVPELLKKIGVNTGQIVADLGCGGGGHFVAPTARMVGTAGFVYAVDIQKKVLGALEASLKLQNIGNVRLVWSDLERVGAADIPEESCDVVFLANVLFQNKNHSNIVVEAARFLKKGGKLVAVDWKPISSVFGPPQELRVSPDAIKTISLEHKLSFIDLFDVGQYHYAAVFQK